MIGSIIALLTAGLQLWGSKEKTKYLDRLIKLKKDFYEEYNKAENERDDAVLDNIAFDIKLLCDSFSSAIGAENASNKQ